MCVSAERVGAPVPRWSGQDSGALYKNKGLHKPHTHTDKVGTVVLRCTSCLQRQKRSDVVCVEFGGLQRCCCMATNRNLTTQEALIGATVALNILNFECT